MPPLQPTMPNVDAKRRTIQITVVRRRLLLAAGIRKIQPKNADANKIADCLPGPGRFEPIAEAAITVRVETACAEAVTVTEAGVNEHVAPAGRPVQEKVTLPAKPFRLVTVSGATTDELA